jgi:mRNA interferase MazF
MEKRFDKWNDQKKRIDIQEQRQNLYVNEREIWWCSLGLNVGDEEDGKNDLFERPVLVIKKFNRNIVLIVPLTTKIKENRYHFQFTYEETAFSAILSQIKLLSTKRFTRKIRKINPNLFDSIKESIILIIRS